MRDSYDVIVVGGGGSGLAAAVSAAEQGADVLLLEKQRQLGGTTAIAVGSFTASQTQVQTAAGVEDSVAQHVQDAGQFAPPEIEARNHAELRAMFLSHAADTLHWLTEMGLQFHGPAPEPPNRAPRMHNIVPNARAYVTTLRRRLERLGGALQTGAGVTELIKEDGRIQGVLVESAGGRQAVRARGAVILAAGDYASSPELIARFKGKEFAEIEGINPHACGDGHRLAERAGAALINMDVTYGPELRLVAPRRLPLLQRLPAAGPLGWLARQAASRAPDFLVRHLAQRMVVTWQHPEDSLLDDGAILVNRRGRRFCDERRPVEREISVARQPERECFFVLDEQLINKYSAWPHFVSTAPRIAYAYVQDYLKLRPDVAVAASALRQVAARRGLPGDALQQTVVDCNRQRSADRRPLLSGNRWVLLGPAKAYFTTTEGGAAIDDHFRVLDEAGQWIEGLYAVGQNGLGGQILWGHGLHIAWALTSGRLAGREAARRAASAGIVE